MAAPAQTNPDFNYVVDYISTNTGLNKSVVAAWVTAENGFANNNPLGMNGGMYYSDLNTALQDTVNNIQTNPLYAGIRSSVSQGPQAQAQAIVNSPWVTGHTSAVPVYLSVFAPFGVTKATSTSYGAGTTAGAPNATATSFDANPVDLMNALLSIFGIKIDVLNVILFVVGVVIVLMGLWKLLNSDQQSGIKELAKAVTLMATGPVEGAVAIPASARMGPVSVRRGQRAEPREPIIPTSSAAPSASGQVPVEEAIHVPDMPTPEYSSEAPRAPEPKPAPQPRARRTRQSTLRQHIREAFQRAGMNDIEIPVDTTIAR